MRETVDVFYCVNKCECVIGGLLGMHCLYKNDISRKQCLLFTKSGQEQCKARLELVSKKTQRWLFTT